MKSAGRGTVDRRLAIGGGLAAAAGLAWPRAQILRRAVTQRGIFGGGIVDVEGAEARFSLFASSLIFDDGEREGEAIFAGRVLWVDAAELTLTSTSITDYENLNSEEGESRRIRGMMDAGDAGEQPFVMDVFDAGGPEAVSDTISLAVGVSAGIGDAATPATGVGFSYAASGTVVSGDVEDIDVAVDFDTGEVTDPGPAA
ncbi:MAG: hypothetical protein ACRDJC_18085 [Thermomicrobiales bacterium]